MHGAVKDVHGDVELGEGLEQFEGLGVVGVLDLLYGIGEEHGAVLEGEVQMLELNHALADVLSGDKTVFVGIVDSAVEAALHGVLDGKGSHGVGVAHGFVEHEGEGGLVHAPTMGVVDVKEVDGLWIVKAVLHVFHFIVDKGSEDGVLQGHATQLGVVLFSQLGKTDALAH